MSTPESNDPAEERRSFLEQRNKHDAAEMESAKFFDQAMLTLSGGALALSITYINQVVPRPTPWTLLLLLPGWGSFCMCLLSTLVSSLASQYAIRDTVRSLDMDYHPGHAVDEEVKQRHEWWIRLRRRLPVWLSGPNRSWGETVDRLNLISAGLFFFGVVSLSLFSLINLWMKA